MLDADLPAEDLVRQVLSSPYTRLPLWRDNTENIIGVIHSKDLLRALSRENGGIEKLDFTELALEPWFVPETTTLREQLNAFRRKRSHFALVIDEYGALMGLVTLEDIIEEIVGDISDEHDIAASGIRVQADGSYLVDGTVTIRDLNRQFDWTLPDEEAATVAGLVIHEARVIPEVGQIFTFYNFRFEILRRERNQVTALRIIPPKPQKQDQA
jgi:Mg2+/Co2+ transporter CorB